MGAYSSSSFIGVRRSSESGIIGCTVRHHTGQGVLTPMEDSTDSEQSGSSDGGARSHSKGVYETPGSIIISNPCGAMGPMEEESPPVQLPEPVGSSVLGSTDSDFPIGSPVLVLVDEQCEPGQGSAVSLSRSGDSDNRCQPPRLGSTLPRPVAQSKWGKIVSKRANFLELEAVRHALLVFQPNLRDHAVKVLSDNRMKVLRHT